jgi:hypothetical protein
MITRRTVLSTVALGASGLVAGAGLLGITPDGASAANAANRNTQEHRRTRHRNRKQRRRQRRR